MDILTDSLCKRYHICLFTDLCDDIGDMLVEFVYPGSSSCFYELLKELNFVRLHNLFIHTSIFVRFCLLSCEVYKTILSKI